MNRDYLPKKRPASRPTRRAESSVELGEINVSLIEFLQDHPDLVSELAPILSRLQQAINGIRIARQDRLTEDRRQLANAPDRMPVSSKRRMRTDQPPPSLFGSASSASLRYEATAKSIQEIDSSDDRIRLQISLPDYENVTHALELLPNPGSFTAKELQVATQSNDGSRMVPMTQLYLVLRFWRDAGLIKRAGGRRFTATYETLKKGIAAQAEQARRNRNY